MSDQFEAAPDDKEYHWQPRPAQNLTELSLCMAADKIGPAFIYRLTVHKTQVLWARSLCRKLAADVEANPLSPYINIVWNESFARDEWMFEKEISGGERVGSPGFG